MKITIKNTTTIISGVAFIIFGVILLLINNTFGYILIGIGTLIEALGGIDEVRNILKKDKK